MKKWLWTAVALVFSGEVNAATTQVDAGTTLNNGYVYAGDEQNVSGTTNNARVYGVQNILSGGIANDSLIYSSGVQNVDSGGTSTGTRVGLRGSLNVGGTAVSSVLSRGSTMTILTGGTAEQTQVGGGDMVVNSGGSAVSTNLQSGYMDVSGTDTDTYIGSSGTQNILSGGRSVGAVVDGSQNIEAGGQAQNAVIKEYGWQDILAGGQASGTLIEGGTQYVFGTVSTSQMTSGSQAVWDGGVLSGATVAGGDLYVHDGGVAENLTVSGGNATINPGGRLTGTTQVNHAAINLDGDISVENMTLNDGSVNLVSQNDFQNINIDRLDGSGVFYLKSDAARTLSDKISVNDGSGNFGLALADFSSEAEFPETLTVVDGAGADDTFYLVGGGADVGAYRYDLVYSGNDWVLQKTPRLSDTSIIAKNTFMSLRSIFYSYLQNTEERLTELQETEKGGLWTKGWGRRFKFDFDDGTHSKMDIWGGQIGYDRQLKQNFARRWLAGVFGGYASSRQKFDRRGNGSGETLSAGVYTHADWNNGYFFNLTGAYYHHTQKVTSYLPFGWKVRGKYNLNGWSAAAETGRRFRFSERWFAEPYLQLAFLDFDNVRYRTNFNTEVDASNEASWLGRAGLKAGRFLKSYPAEIYGQINVVREFSGSNRVRVADYTFVENLRDTFYEAGLGIKTRISDNFSAYANVFTMFGDKVEMPWDVSIGLRWTF